MIFFLSCVEVFFHSIPVVKLQKTDERFFEQGEYIFTATVTDEKHHYFYLDVSWQHNGAHVCSEAVVDVYDQTLCNIDIKEGPQEIALRITNPKGFAREELWEIEGLSENADYRCLFGDCDKHITLSDTIGIDLMRIEADDLIDPLGRYQLEIPFYMMTTELTEGMNALLRNGEMTNRPDVPVGYLSWNDAAELANALSVFDGYEECYVCLETTNGCTEKGDPTSCSGYAIPTEAQWELSARSGSTASFWTGKGEHYGGEPSSLFSCTGDEEILDGSGSLLGDYAWYCATEFEPEGPKEVAQKLPNGFGLFDMHGNLGEWTADWWGCSDLMYEQGQWCDLNGAERTFRGACWYAVPRDLQVDSRINVPIEQRESFMGVRFSRNILE